MLDIASEMCGDNIEKLRMYIKQYFSVLGEERFDEMVQIVTNIYDELILKFPHFGRQTYEHLRMFLNTFSGSFHKILPNYRRGEERWIEISFARNYFKYCENGTADPKLLIQLLATMLQMKDSYCNEDILTVTKRLRPFLATFHESEPVDRQCLRMIDYKEEFEDVYFLDYQIVHWLRYLEYKLKKLLSHYQLASGCDEAVEFLRKLVQIRNQLPIGHEALARLKDILRTALPIIGHKHPLSREIQG
jgi:hypothetical protein